MLQTPQAYVDPAELALSYPPPPPGLLGCPHRAAAGPAPRLGGASDGAGLVGGGLDLYEAPVPMPAAAAAVVGLSRQQASSPASPVPPRRRAAPSIAPTPPGRSVFFDGG